MPNCKTLLLQKAFLLIVLISLYSVKSNCYIRDTCIQTLSGYNSYENEDHVGMLYIFFFHRFSPRKKAMFLT